MFRRKYMLELLVNSRNIDVRSIRQWSSGRVNFGFIFDIDGVFVRGKRVLSEARAAVKELLLDKNGQWRVPAVFVTNAGHTLKHLKAKQLSENLHCRVHPNQVVMSHSPLRMFREFHNKRMLVSGQAEAKTIAQSLGFKDAVTLDEFACQYPKLDAYDCHWGKREPCAFEQYNKKIDGILLLDVPHNWERSLQLLTDVLLSHGLPYGPPPANCIGTNLNSDKESRVSNEVDDGHRVFNVYPHIPVLACNADLTWMSEAPLPRIGHGVFLNFLEQLYFQLSGGHRLLYSGLLGKPSEVTYCHAEWRLNEVAESLSNDDWNRFSAGPTTMFSQKVYSNNETGRDTSGMDAGGTDTSCMDAGTINSNGRGIFRRPLQRIYCVGDNPQTDIYGANLYNQFLQDCHKSHDTSEVDRQTVSDPFCLNSVVHRTVPPSVYSGKSCFAKSCLSVLVCTGVFQKTSSDKSDREIFLRLMKQSGPLNHHYKDILSIPELKVPNMLSEDVYTAVRDVYAREKLPLFET